MILYMKEQSVFSKPTDRAGPPDYKYATMHVYIIYYGLINVHAETDTIIILS